MNIHHEIVLIECHTRYVDILLVLFLLQSFKGLFTLSVSDAVSVSINDAKIMGTEYYQWYRSHWS